MCHHTLQKYMSFTLFSAMTLLTMSYEINAGGNLPAQIISTKDKSEMVLIPQGPFIFGMDQSDIKRKVSEAKELFSDIFKTEYSRTTITLPYNYYIDRYEVTNSKYAIFMRETGHRQPKFWNFPQLNSSLQPVVGVGWSDADAYCRWAGKRLPTEMEWEKAARGTDGQVWPWGNTADDSKFNGRKKDFNIPINVGSFPTGNSPYGVSDMAGNVWEMTSSTFKGGEKMMKGGSFLNTNAFTRTTVHWCTTKEKEEQGSAWLGFRCVKDIK